MLKSYILETLGLHEITKSTTFFVSCIFRFERWWQLTYFWNFHPENWGRFPFLDLRIFFKGIGSTTNQINLHWNPLTKQVPGWWIPPRNHQLENFSTDRQRCDGMYQLGIKGFGLQQCPSPFPRVVKKVGFGDELLFF